MPDLAPAINLFFLPLLGGYLFLLRFNVTRPFTERWAGPRVVLHAATVGLVLLIAARAVVLFGETFSDNGWPVTVLLWGVVPGLVLCTAVSLIALFVVQWRKNRAFTDYRLAAALGVVLALVLGAGSLTVVTSTPDIPPLALIYALLTAVLSGGIVGGYWYWLRNYMPDFPLPSVAIRFVLLGMLISLSIIVSGAHAPATTEAWDRFVTIERSGTPFIALVLGIVLPWFMSALFPYKASVASLHSRERSNSLERLFFNASLNKLLVQITLEDHKVYVGYIRHLPPNSSVEHAFVEVLPSFSGYRKADTHEVLFTTFYEEIYDRLLADDDRDLGEFFKVIPVRRIVSASVFDPEVYLSFNRSEDEPAISPPISDKAASSNSA